MKKKIKFDLSTQVLIALVLGLVAGIFFGEMVSPLQLIGNAFIMLLQMTVLPFITVSLIVGIGRLEPKQAKEMAIKGGFVILLLTAIALAVVSIFPLAFPNWKSASFFSTTMIESRPPFDILALYIPANPFFSLANNVVPAVVLFAIVVGVALMTQKNKRVILDPLDALMDTFMRISGAITRLAPIGIFALMASTAGTVKIEEFGRLQVYLYTYIAVTLLLSFWVLPMLIVTLTPLRYRDIISRTKDALITAFATGNLVIVLPILIAQSKELLPPSNKNDIDSSSTVDVLIPTSFNFPNIAVILALTFISFAGWFVGTPLSAAKLPTLLVSGFFTLFGSTAFAVPFLLDTFRLPSDMFQLFLGVDIINTRFGTLLAAMHILTVGLLGSALMDGKVILRPKKLLQFTGVTVVLMLGMLVGLRHLYDATIDSTYTKADTLIKRSFLNDPIPAVVYNVRPEKLPRRPTGPRLASILRSGVLRVGFDPGGIPYSYFNDAGILVGLDVEMANTLAKEMGVKLELIPMERNKISLDLQTGVFDIAMAGIPITTDRIKSSPVSIAYLTETIAFLVPDFNREAFSSRDKLRKVKNLKIGVPENPYYLNKLKEALPDANLIIVPNIIDYLRADRSDLDAILYTAERGSVLSLLFPSYSIAIPKPKSIAVPLGYLLPPKDIELESFVNTWIDLKKKDGTIDSLYRYWILGDEGKWRKPRWSIYRDVLKL